VLPDGILSNQKSQFGKILEGLAIEDVGIFMAILSLFYGQMVHAMAIWYILLPFGIFFPFLVYCTEKNLATLEPILQFLNLQLQRQRCSRLESV
jgi:hypothetical protein